MTATSLLNPYFMNTYIPTTKEKKTKQNNKPCQTTPPNPSKA